MGGGSLISYQGFIVLFFLLNFFFFDCSFGLIIYFN